MNTFNYLKHLDRSNIDSGIIIRKTPGIEEIQTKQGKRFKVSYYVSTTSTPLKKISFLSSSNKFDTLDGILLYSHKMDQLCKIELKETITPDVVNKFVSLLAKSKYNLNSRVLGLRKKFNSIKLNEGECSLIDTYKEIKLLNEFKVNVNIHSIQTAILIMSFLTSVAALYLLIRFYVLSLKLQFEENRARTTIEQKINKELFKNQTGDEPVFNVYAELNQSVDYVINGASTSLIIHGPPGMSKTYTVRRRLYFSGLKPGSDYVILKGGTLGLKEVYSFLYKYRDSSLFFYLQNYMVICIFAKMY